MQVSAVRIVNGGRVDGEVFDTLVYPRRRILASSTEVHEFTKAMVAEACFIDEAPRRFHKFVEGEVRIARNAPFDLAYLRHLEPQPGIAFDNPILDTVPLSAVVYSQHQVYSLGAVTHWLRITIPEGASHAA